MRPILDLLHVLREAMETGNHIEGMCHAISDLEVAEIIDIKEEKALLSYLRANAPIRVKDEAKELTKRCPENRDASNPIAIFWYPLEDILPRTKWLTRRINLEKYPKQ